MPLEPSFGPFFVIKSLVLNKLLSKPLYTLDVDWMYADYLAWYIRGVVNSFYVDQVLNRN